MVSRTILESKQDISYDEMCILTESLDWGAAYFPTEERFRYTLAASAHVAYVRDQEYLIGFGRVVEDGMNCMFYDICVRPDYQGQYIGTMIMEHLINQVKDKNYSCIGLFREDENETVHLFYQKLGFKLVQAMELTQYMRVNWD